MEIRLAKECDIPGILELLRQVGQVHHRLRPELFQPNMTKYDAIALSALLEHENTTIFVAVEEGFVLGYCFCGLIEYKGNNISARRKEIYIDDLCVDENRRGTGIAQSLYRHVTDWAKGLGCAFITLNVWCGNEQAMRFYEKAGLRPRSITMEMEL